MLNSIYGKTVQAIEDKITKEYNTGSSWNPLYGSVITGGTRARMAEFIRLNNVHNCINTATDGIVIKNHQNLIIPPRPLEAPHNLGEWEDETPKGKADIVIVMSGVYSLRGDKDPKIKTTYRGNASYFIGRKDQPKNWFQFLEENKNESSISRDEHNHPNSRPYSLGEARMKGDYSLTNVFRIVKASVSAMGDTNKRNWLRPPKTFGHLILTKWRSKPHDMMEVKLWK